MVQFKALTVTGKTLGILLQLNIYLNSTNVQFYYLTVIQGIDIKMIITSIHFFLGWIDFLKTNDKNW